jgi:hypothetical protein
MEKFFHEASIRIRVICVPCLPLLFFSMTCKREAETASLPHGRIALFFALAVTIFLPGEDIGGLRQ